VSSPAAGASHSRELPAIEKTITGAQVRRYAEASGDFNPVHLDEEFAAKSSFGRIVAHGMLTLAFLSEMMTQAYGGSWLDSGSLKVRFRRPAYPGDRVRTQGQVTEEVERDGVRRVRCAVALLNSEDGEEIISGTAEVRVPIGKATQK